MDEILLRIEDLTIGLKNSGRPVVKNISFDIAVQKIVALVGGSGSGKTTTGLSILRLLPEAMQVSRGRILYKGKDLLMHTPEDVRRLRGKEIGMVFQEPLNAFNPVFRIGYQIEEVLRYHTALTPVQRIEKILSLLALVGVPDPKRVAASFPHQLSGGLRQRAMIAQAIAAEPALVIADEPTSNLDVTLQAHVMDVFRRLKKELGLSILLITHDLGVVKHLADEVAVLCEGELVEKGAAAEIFERCQHRYTRQLVEAFK